MNRKDTEKDMEKDTEKDTEQPKSSRASNLVPILAPRRAPKDGCRFRRILCTVGRVKADRRGPNGQPGRAGWGLEGQVCPGEPEARSLQGKFSPPMAPVPIRVDRDRRLHRNGSNLAPVAYGSAPGRLLQQQVDVRAALREGAYALTAHSRVRSESSGERALPPRRVPTRNIPCRVRT